MIHRKASGKELFGFYKDIAGKPEWKKRLGAVPVQRVPRPGI